MAKRKGNRPALASLLDQYGNTCKSLKLKPTYANLIAVKQFAGTSAGRFYLKGWLTRRQLDAADAFATALHNYDRAMGMPSRTAKCLNMLAVKGKPSDGDPTRRDRVAIHMYEAMVAKIGCKDILIACATEDRITMLRNKMALAAALDRVADHLGIERKEAA